MLQARHRFASADDVRLIRIVVSVYEQEIPHKYASSSCSIWTQRMRSRIKLSSHLARWRNLDRRNHRFIRGQSRSAFIRPATPTTISESAPRGRPYTVRDEIGLI